MFKIIIKRNNIESSKATFETMEIANEWIEKESLNGSFGKLAYDEVIYEEGSLDVILETIHHEAEFTVEIEDISAQIAQDEINKEALKHLVDTDYLIIREMDSGEICPVAIKESRAAARLRVIR